MYIVEFFIRWKFHFKQKNSNLKYSEDISDHKKLLSQ